MAKKGLFIGVVTLDLVYLAAGIPGNNQKIVASDYSVTAGGPATNAAVTFSYLGDKSTLLGVVGEHILTNLILEDLANYQVEIIDLDETHPDPPPISSIIVTETTGERAVVSLNATKIQASSHLIPPNILQGIDIVLIDGHLMEVGYAIAKLAKSKKIPVVVDGGSWKPGFEKLLPLVDYAICSANFYPPNCHNAENVVGYLATIGIPYIAVTDGANRIRYCSKGKNGWVGVPQVNVVDTLGAGDILHGAFCHYILREQFVYALAYAAEVAAYSCQFFGTREFMNKSEN